MKRYFIIMFVCACALYVFVGNASAQLANGDIVTIKSGNNYLGVNNNADAIANITAGDLKNSGVRALWKVTITQNNSNTYYYFQSVAASNASKTNDELYFNNNAWSLGTTGSGLRFGSIGYNADLNKTEGRLYYYSKNGENKYKYIQYDTGWKVLQTKNSSNNDNKTLITIEKWELKTVAGGLKGDFSKEGEVDFGWAENDAVAAGQSITRTFTVTSSAAKTYYDCLNTADVEQVGLTESDLMMLFSDLKFVLTFYTAL